MGPTNNEIQKDDLSEGQKKLSSGNKLIMEDSNGDAHLVTAEMTDDERLKIWLPNCIGAAICFALGNSVISLITS